MSSAPIDRTTLDERFAELGLRGYWQERMEPPRPKTQPRLWRWADIYPALTAAGEIVKLGPDAFRRHIALQTGSRTMAFGFQVVLPGETAAAHRHTNSAVRFVVMGSGAFTTSNGERMFMEPGDLLIQPNWTWHDHSNETDEPIIWIDSLDGGVGSLLEASFRESWVEGDLQPITKPDGYARRVFGSSVGYDMREIDPNAIPYRYKWTDTLAALQALEGEGVDDPYDGVLMEYRNPVTGGHTFRTMSCRIQLLRPGQAMRAHRHTGTTHYHVVGGEGKTVMDKGSLEMEWGEKDSFIVPSWQWHQHWNTSKDEQAILFSITDIPVVESTGLYREEKG